MSAPVEQNQSDSEESVRSAPQTFVPSTSGKDIQISPRMVRTSGNDQGSHPANNKCCFSSQEENHDATDQERVYQGSTKEPVGDPKTPQPVSCHKVATRQDLLQAIRGNKINETDDDAESLRRLQGYGSGDEVTGRSSTEYLFGEFPEHLHEYLEIPVNKDLDNLAAHEPQRSAFNADDDGWVTYDETASQDRSRDRQLSNSNREQNVQRSLKRSNTDELARSKERKSYEQPSYSQSTHSREKGVNSGKTYGEKPHGNRRASSAPSGISKESRSLSKKSPSRPSFQPPQNMSGQKISGNSTGEKRGRELTSQSASQDPRWAERQKNRLDQKVSQASDATVKSLESRLQKIGKQHARFSTSANNPSETAVRSACEETNESSRSSLRHHSSNTERYDGEQPWASAVQCIKPINDMADYVVQSRTQATEHLSWSEHTFIPPGVTGSIPLRLQIPSGLTDQRMRLAIHSVAMTCEGGLDVLQKVLYTQPPNHSGLRDPDWNSNDWTEYFKSFSEGLEKAVDVPAYSFTPDRWRGKIVTRMKAILEQEKEKETKIRGEIITIDSDLLPVPTGNQRNRQHSSVTAATPPRYPGTPLKPLSQLPHGRGEGSGILLVTTDVEARPRELAPSRVPPAPPAIPQMAHSLPPTISSMEAISLSHDVTDPRGKLYTLEAAGLQDQMSINSVRANETLDLAHRNSERLQKISSEFSQQAAGKFVDSKKVQSHCATSTAGAKRIADQLLCVRQTLSRSTDQNRALAQELVDISQEHVQQNIPDGQDPQNQRTAAGYMQRASARSAPERKALPAAHGTRTVFSDRQLWATQKWYAHQLSLKLPTTHDSFKKSKFGQALSAKTSMDVAKTYYEYAKRESSELLAQAHALVKTPSYHTQANVNYIPHHVPNRYSSMVSSSSVPSVMVREDRPPQSSSTQSQRRTPTQPARSESSDVHERARSPATHKPEIAQSPDVQAHEIVQSSDVQAQTLSEKNVQTEMWQTQIRQRQFPLDTQYCGSMGSVYNCAVMCHAIEMVYQHNKNGYADRTYGGKSKNTLRPGQTYGKKLWKALGCISDNFSSSDPGFNGKPWDLRRKMIGCAIDMACYSRSVDPNLTLLDPSASGDDELELHSFITKHGVPRETTLRWLKLYQEDVKMGIIDNIQRSLERGIFSPEQNNLIRETQRDAIRSDIQSGASVGPTNAVQAISLIITELRAGQGSTVGAWNLASIIGGSGRLLSTQRTIVAVVDQLLVTKFETHQMAVEHHQVKLRAYMAWKSTINAIIQGLNNGEVANLLSTSPEVTNQSTPNHGETFKLTFNDYTWAVPIRELNRLYHALHGNGSTNKSITKKMDVTNIPILKSTDTTAEAFVLWTIDLRAWCKIQLIEDLVLNRSLRLDAPNGVSPNLGTYKNTASDLAEGLRYLCAAIEDVDLQNGVSTNGLVMNDVLEAEIKRAANADPVERPDLSVGTTNPKGHLGFDWLKEEFLQGAQIQPIMQDILDNLELCPTKGIVSFKAKFKKIADCLDPPMPPAILSQKFNTSITRGTGSLYQNCITSASGSANKTDFKAYSMLLTRLIQEVHATSCDSKMETALAARMAKMEQAFEARALPTHPNATTGKKPPERTAGKPKNRRENSRPYTGCPRCGSKEHPTSQCRLKKMSCSFMLPNGQPCGQDHADSRCWYKNPESCPDPKIKQLIKAKLESWQTTSRTAMKAVREGSYLDEDDTYSESAHMAKCGDCHDEITDKEWAEISPSNWDTAWTLINRKNRKGKSKTKHEQLMSHRAHASDAPKNPRVRALMARTPKGAVSTPQRPSDFTRSRGLDPTETNADQFADSDSEDMDVTDTNPKSPSPQSGSKDPPKVERQRGYLDLKTSPGDPVELLDQMPTPTQTHNDPREISDSPMSRLFCSVSDPDVLTIYKRGWEKAVGTVTQYTSGYRIHEIPEYVQLGDTQNMGPFVPYPQLRMLLIATRLCLQTNPHDTGGCARKAIIALMIQLGAGTARSIDARSLSAAIIHAARPNAYHSIENILEFWDITISCLRFWDNIVIKLLQSETGLRRSQIHKVKNIHLHAKSLTLHSVQVDPIAVNRANLRLRFLNLPVPMLPPVEQIIFEKRQDIPDLGHIFADVRADQQIEKLLYQSFGRLPNPGEEKRNNARLDRKNWSPHESTQTYDFGLQSYTEAYKTWPHSEEPFHQSQWREGGGTRKQALRDLIENAKTHLRNRPTASCIPEDTSIQAFMATIKTSELSADSWRKVATESSQNGDCNPSRISEICCNAAEGLEMAIQGISEKIADSHQNGNDMEIIGLMIEKGETNPFIKNESKAPPLQPIYDGDGTNKIDLICRELPYILTEGIISYTKHLLDTGQYSACAQNMYNPKTFSKGVLSFIKDIGAAEYPEKWNTEPLWDASIKAMIGTIKAFGIQKCKDTLGEPGEIFIDTGCSDHLCCDRRCLINLDKHKRVRIPIETANGISMAESQGPAIFTVRDTSGEWINIQRTVLYCPSLTVNLFSPNKDFEVHGTRVAFNDECILTLTNGIKIPFIRADNTYKLMYKVQKEQALAAKVFINDSLLEIWHRRLGHLPPPSIIRASTTSVGMPDMSSYEESVGKRLKQHCPSCPVSNQKQSPHKNNAKKYKNKLVSAYGDRIHMDLAGPIELSINGGFKYASTFIDEFTLHIGVYCIRAKSEQIIAHKNYIADMAYAGSRDIKEFHSDNGGEYISKDYKDLVLENGARKSTIVPKSPNMNPIAEGTFWRLFSLVRAMLKDSGMPNTHWARAIYQAAYILNRMPSAKTNKSPYETLQGRKPQMNHIKIFGCLAYGLKPKHDRTSKLDDIADIGYHVGVARYQRGWVLFIPDKKDPTQGKYKVYRTVHFNEGVLYRDQLSENTVPITLEGVVFGGGQPETEEDAQEGPPSPDDNANTTHATNGSGDDEDNNPSDNDEDEGDEDGIPPPPRPKNKTQPTRIPKPRTPATPRVKHSHTFLEDIDITHCGHAGCTKTAGHDGNCNGPAEQPDVEGLPSKHLRKRAHVTMVGVDKTSTTENYELNLDILDNAESDRCNKLVRAYAATKKRFRDEDNNLTLEIFVPKNYDEAVSCPDAKHWMKAMDIEMESHQRSGTWELIPAMDVRKGKKPVGSTWAYDVKRRADGTIERYKARLCAQGFSQIFGHDYNVTYSNTVRYSTLRTLFSVAASRNYILHGADVKTAYLNGYIEEGTTLYMRQAKGYQETDSEGNGQVCLLKRSIYGLKQSGLCWEIRLAAHLEKMGFERSDVDRCLYKVERDSGTMYMCVYVDDLCMASSSEAIHTEILEELQKTFETKDTGPLTWIFGTAIIQDLTKGTITVSQKLYAEDTVTQLKDLIDRLATTRSRSIPCSEEIALLEVLQEGELINPEYRSILGKLGWMNMISRPDLAYCYSMLSRHAAKGGERHMVVMANALKYLSKTTGYVLVYRRDGCEKFHKNITDHSDFRCDTLTDESITTFTDSSHGGERPMAGYAIMIGGTPIDWRAYRSSVTPLSSCQGEYVASSTATVATLGARGVGKFFGISDSEPTVVFCDNKAAVQLSDGDTSSKKMVHIATRIAFLREQVRDKTILLYHIKTQGQIADIFTKPLGASIFHNLRQLLVHGPG